MSFPRSGSGPPGGFEVAPVLLFCLYGLARSCCGHNLETVLPSLFQTADQAEQHAETHWRIVRASDNLCVLDVYTSKDSLTRLLVPWGILEPASAYCARAA
jgi:hypothetical protein